MSPWPPPHLDLVKRIQTDNRIFKEPEKKSWPQRRCAVTPPSTVGHRDRRERTRAQQGHQRRDTGLGQEGARKQKSETQKRHSKKRLGDRLEPVSRDCQL